jgi:ribonuclease-3
LSARRLRTQAAPADPDRLLDWAEQALGRRFKAPALLIEALTHTSLGGRTYQRLEFLGDRVLGLVMAALVFERFPKDSEGTLARRLNDLVRRETCARIARDLDVSSHIRLERTAANAGVAHSETVLGDVCEALIGALYRDGGLSAARSFILARWGPLLDQPDAAAKDAKSALQEWAQGRGLPLPDYALVGRFGPDHAPLFRVCVQVRGLEPVEAEGASKQEAQMRAAASLLAKLTEGQAIL